MHIKAGDWLITALLGALGPLIYLFSVFSTFVLWWGFVRGAAHRSFFVLFSSHCGPPIFFSKTSQRVQWDDGNFILEGVLFCYTDIINLLLGDRSAFISTLSCIPMVDLPWMPSFRFKFGETWRASLSEWIGLDFLCRCWALRTQPHFRFTDVGWPANPAFLKAHQIINPALSLGLPRPGGPIGVSPHKTHPFFSGPYTRGNIKKDKCLIFANNASYLTSVPISSSILSHETTNQSGFSFLERSSIIHYTS